jgi:hypothetical protein
MKFKVQFVSAVFKAFGIPENNEETKPIPYFCPMQKKYRDFQFEFVALMASLMSVVALASMPYCRLWILVTIGTTEVVDNQLLITMIFLGLGFGPLVFGPFQIVLVENQSCTWVLPCLLRLVLYV